MSYKSTIKLVRRMTKELDAEVSLLGVSMVMAAFLKELGFSDFLDILKAHPSWNTQEDKDG